MGSLLPSPNVVATINAVGEHNTVGDNNMLGEYNIIGHNNVNGHHNVTGYNNVVGNNNVVGDNNLILQFYNDTEDDDNKHNDDNNNNDNHDGDDSDTSDDDSDTSDDEEDDDIDYIMDEKQNNSNTNTNTNTNTNINKNNSKQLQLVNGVYSLHPVRKLKNKKRKRHGIDSNTQRKKRKLNNADIKSIKQKQLRLKYMKINQFINHLLSLNGKKLENILLLKKSDIMENINGISSVLTYNKNKLIIPKIIQGSDGLSFYGVLFEGINSDNNAHKHTYSLWDILLKDKNKNIMSEFVIRLWIGQLLVAVNVLHENNMIHLDISPESIKINMSEHTLLLTAFNTIKFATNQTLIKDIDYKLLNCCWQMSPNINKRNFYTGRGFKSFDMWSIGKLTLFLLTGQLNILSENVRISKLANDFITKLLSNQMTAKKALNHEWMTDDNKINDDVINRDKTIDVTMYKQHQKQLINKNKILAQEMKDLLINDQKELNKEIEKLNEQISKIKINKFNDKQAVAVTDDAMGIIKAKEKQILTSSKKIKKKQNDIVNSKQIKLREICKKNSSVTYGRKENVMQIIKMKGKQNESNKIDKKNKSQNKKNDDETRKQINSEIGWYCVDGKKYFYWLKEGKDIHQWKKKVVAYKHILRQRTKKTNRTSNHVTMKHCVPEGDGFRCIYKRCSVKCKDRQNYRDHWRFHVKDDKKNKCV